MADNSNPPAPAAAPAAAPAGGTGTGAAAPAAEPSPAPAAPAGGGDPKIPTEPAAAAEYWKKQATEATATITRTTQQNARYKELFGELDFEDPTKPKPAADGSTLPPNVWTEEKQRDWELTQQIGRIPTLVPHAQEIKDLVVTGKVSLEEAKETVARRHNITLGPVSGPMDMMPTVPGGGATPPASGFTNEQLEAMRKDGIDPEKAKKHVGTLNEITRRALKR